MRGASLSRLGRQAGLRLSDPCLFFSISPVQVFAAGNKQFNPDGLEKHAPRPYQGMDMRKINDYPFISHRITRVPMKSGYQYHHFATPSIDAPTHGDVASFFDTADMTKKYTPVQILKSAGPEFRFMLMGAACVLIPATPILLFVLYMNRFEPMEHDMDPEEYYRNFRWNYYGPELDHHAYDQYLEARRSKKWRDVDVNPEDYIPSEYKGQ